MWYCTHWVSIIDRNDCVPFSLVVGLYGSKNPGRGIYTTARIRAPIFPRRPLRCVPRETGGAWSQAVESRPTSSSSSRTAIPLYKCKVIATSSLLEKAAAFDMDVEIRASFLGGLIKVSGAGMLSARFAAGNRSPLG